MQDAESAFGTTLIGRNPLVRGAAAAQNDFAPSAWNRRASPASTMLRLGSMLKTTSRTLVAAGNALATVMAAKMMCTTRAASPSICKIAHTGRDCNERSISMTKL